MRMDVRRVETLRTGTNAVGNRTRSGRQNRVPRRGTQIFDPVTSTTHRIEDVVDGRKALSCRGCAKDGTLHAGPWCPSSTRERRM